MFSDPGQQSESQFGGNTPGSQHGHGFGTAPVFLASVSTILGAILFLRFGYAVAHAGLWGSLMVIALGHLVTVPTVLAAVSAVLAPVAAIAAIARVNRFGLRRSRRSRRRSRVEIPSTLS